MTEDWIVSVPWAANSVIVSVVLSTTYTSLPKPPIKVSLPKPPLRILLPLLPVMRLLPALPVPLILPVPVKSRFSILLDKVVVTALCKVSVIVTVPVVLPRVALTGLERITVKVSSDSLRLSLRIGIEIVPVVALAAIVRVPVVLV